MSSPGRLIVIEGPGGVGKSTLAGGLRSALDAAGLPCAVWAFPGREAGALVGGVEPGKYGPNRNRIQKALTEDQYRQLLASDLDVIRGRLVPEIGSGRWVILDGYWWSKWVYGRLAGAWAETLREMIDTERAAWGVALPSPAFLIRRERPPSRDVPLAEWARLSGSYDDLAGCERENHEVEIVENDGLVEGTVARMLLAIPGVRSRTASRKGEARSARSARTPDTIAGTTDADSGKRTEHGEEERNAELGRGGPAIICPLSPARPSRVYETYWRFAAERQAVFFRKIEGAFPLTSDPILAEYKFTNAYRASDRVSQYLIREVIYRHDPSVEETFFRIILFKLFNKIATWELLEREIGTPSWREYSRERYADVLESAMRSNLRIYSAAYIMPSGSGAFEDRRKHISHLRLLERMMEDGLPGRIADSRTMLGAFELLRSYPMIGDFLAYQYVTDVNYSRVTDFGEMQFAVPGPGARDGIRKCFESLGGLSEVDIIKWVADHQEREFERHGVGFRTLWGRPLQLIDCQNLFCEVDKYARRAHPEVRGLSGRTRIKQSYRPRLTAITYWYPPKWGINERASTHQEAHSH